MKELVLDRIEAMHERLGTAGFVLSILALIFALAGGAYAANGGLNPKQKKQVKAIAKSFAKEGPAGPQGAPGAPGPAGKDGAAGTNGTNGTNGTSVTGVAASGAECEFGGVKYTSASGTNKVCNGEPGAAGTNGTNGEPWVVGTAPSGAVLKGTFALHTTAAAPDETIPVAASFSVPVSASGIVVDYVQSGEPDPLAAALGEPACAGSVGNPTPGTAAAVAQGLTVLCAYGGGAVNIKQPTAGDLFAGFIEASSQGGIVFSLKSTAAGPAEEFGSWALQVP